MGFFSKSNNKSEEEYRRERERMVEYQLLTRDVSNEEVLAAMARVPRHEFVPPELRRDAYEDGPLPIGCGQTISQPYVVASMTEHLNPARDKVVLEIGTGSGYQTAILAELFSHIHTVEYFEELSQKAQQVLYRLGYTNISFYIGDGMEIPPPDQIQFDAIILTAAPPTFPESLPHRLKPGGHIVLPVGEDIQDLKKVTKDDQGNMHITSLYPVRFVPLRRHQ